MIALLQTYRYQLNQVFDQQATALLNPKRKTQLFAFILTLYSSQADSEFFLFFFICQFSSGSLAIFSPMYFSQVLFFLKREQSSDSVRRLSLLLSKWHFSQRVTKPQATSGILLTWTNRYVEALESRIPLSSVTTHSNLISLTSMNSLVSTKLIISSISNLQQASKSPFLMQVFFISSNSSFSNFHRSSNLKILFILWIVAISSFFSCFLEYTVEIELLPSFCLGRILKYVIWVMLKGYSTNERISEKLKSCWAPLLQYPTQNCCRYWTPCFLYIDDLLILISLTIGDCYFFLENPETQEGIYYFSSLKCTTSLSQSNLKFWSISWSASLFLNFVKQISLNQYLSLLFSFLTFLIVIRLSLQTMKIASLLRKMKLQMSKQYPFERCWRRTNRFFRGSSALTIGFYCTIFLSIGVLLHSFKPSSNLSVSMLLEKMLAIISRD